jgi:hypothetical protein
MASDFPEHPTLHAQLTRASGGYAATLTLPGTDDRQTFTGQDLDDARAQVADATRDYLRRTVGRPGRLLVEDPDGTWELGVPHDNTPLVALSQPPAADAEDTTSADVTLHARVRPRPGGHRATLMLPGGDPQTFTATDLDDARAQVADATRDYLRRTVGRPGRLLVDDPDGVWLLGVPHDDSPLVSLPLEGAAQPRPRRRARPAKPRSRRSRDARPPRARSRVLAVVALTAVVVILAAATVALLDPMHRPAAHANERVGASAAAATHSATASERAAKAPAHAPRPQHHSRSISRQSRHASRTASRGRHAAHTRRSPDRSRPPHSTRPIPHQADESQVTSPSEPSTTPPAETPAPVETTPAPVETTPAPGYTPPSTGAPPSPSDSGPTGPTGSGSQGSNCDPQCS